MVIKTPYMPPVTGGGSRVHYQIVNNSLLYAHGTADKNFDFTVKLDTPDFNVKAIMLFAEANIGSGKPGIAGAKGARVHLYISYDGGNTFIKYYTLHSLVGTSYHASSVGGLMTAFVEANPGDTIIVRIQYDYLEAAYTAMYVGAIWIVFIGD